MENDYLNGDVTQRIIFKFEELKYERKQVHLSPHDSFYYVDLHMVHEREKCTPCAHIFPGLLM